jgi:hypothetical protein
LTSLDSTRQYGYRDSQLKVTRGSNKLSSNSMVAPHAPSFSIAHLLDSAPTERAVTMKFVVLLLRHGIYRKSELVSGPLDGSASV